MSLLIETIKEDIRAAQAVSFDIFDTLLLRPYVMPYHQFRHMEKLYKMPGFHQERYQAEYRVRARHPELEEITLAMIYHEIDGRYKHMEAKELEWETTHLRANREMKQVYDYARKLNKNILILSDMYLPQEFLARILQKTGFDFWDLLIVSSEVGKTKKSGSLFKLVLENTGISAPNILHIGDYVTADYESAKNCGIKPVLYQRVIEQYLSEHPLMRFLVKCFPKSLKMSSFTGKRAYLWQEKRCTQ